MRILIAAAALFVTACGPTQPSGPSPSGVVQPTATAPANATAGATAEPAASLPAGAIQFRVVNLRHDELWHNPDPASVGSTGNALVPADPATGLLLVVGVALKNADFGLRLGYDGVVGCQVNRTSESILVGGNQIAVFAVPQSADVLLYDNRDSECAEEPVGGPFAVGGGPGTRTLLLLYGEPGAMFGIDLPID